LERYYREEAHCNVPHLVMTQAIRTVVQVAMMSDWVKTQVLAMTLHLWM
jgi:hypothetical protein